METTLSILRFERTAGSTVMAVISPSVVISCLPVTCEFKPHEGPSCLVLTRSRKGFQCDLSKQNCCHHNQ